MNAVAKHVGGGYMNELSVWKRLYREEFGIDLEDSSLEFPHVRPDDSRLIIVSRDLDYDEVFRVLDGQSKARRTYTELGASIGQEERTCEKTYAVFVRDAVESDTPFGSVSGPTVTLMEHLLHHLASYRDTGQFLDREDITACLGSRYVDGRIPTTLSHRGELRIHWCSSGDIYPRLLTRPAFV